jgi:CRISPR-associated endoribonuclease Cas6
MRIKITLSQGSKRQIIPINYNYFISSFLYRTIETADSEYSKWLHDTGYASGSKSFKYFTFSGLNIPERELVHNSYISVLSPRIELTVSMLSDKAIESFVIGMFEKKKLSIHNNCAKSEFDIHTVERLPDPQYSNCMTFRTMSPVVISKNVIFKDKPSAKYLSPDDEDFGEYFAKNLLEKHNALPHNGSGDQPELESFECTDTAKSRLITIREGLPEETKVKGYTFNFRLKGSPELMKLGYEAGFGNLCSLGFGCVSARRG